MNKIVIGITGHRILSAGQKERIKPVLRKAIQNIMFSCSGETEPVSFIALSPLAEGADTLFANAALSLGLQLQVILPYERDEYLKSFSSDEVRNDFHTIYDAVADEHKSQLNSVRDKELNQLFLDIGQKIADEADYLIAIWDEKKAKGKGGTGDIVDYALSKKKNILILNPEHTYLSIDYLNPDYPENKVPTDTIGTTEPNPFSKRVLARHEGYDALAVDARKKYRLIWTIAFVTGLAELLAFDVILAFHPDKLSVFLLSSLELLGILTIISLLIFGRSKQLHSSYLRSRIISERLRIMYFFSGTGLNMYPTAVSPIYFSLREKPEFSIIEHTVRSVNLSAWSYLPFEKKKQQLQSELIEDQLNYHQRKKEKYERINAAYKRFRSLLFLLLVCAIFLDFFHVADDYFLERGMYSSTILPHLFRAAPFSDIVLFISLFIPAAVAASEALKYLYEWEKITTLSGAMASYFKQEAKKLAYIADDRELEEFLNSINRDMLIENLDWEKYMHDKNEVPT